MSHPDLPVVRENGPKHRISLERANERLFSIISQTYYQFFRNHL